jgi:hypothetical protein
MPEQVDIAVDLGAVPLALPEILTLARLVETAPAPPPEVIEGRLHQGCKMILGGSSKSNTSWCLLDLAISVASGEKWWGRALRQNAGGVHQLRVASLTATFIPVHANRPCICFRKSPNLDAAGRRPWTG